MQTRAIRRMMNSQLDILSGDTKPFYQIFSSDLDKVKLEPLMENVNGFACYVTEANTKHGYQKIWIDPQNNYLVRKAIVKKTGTDLDWNDMPLSHGLQKITKIDFLLECLPTCIQSFECHVLTQTSHLVSLHLLVFMDILFYTKLIADYTPK